MKPCSDAWEGALSALLSPEPPSPENQSRSITNLQLNKKNKRSSFIFFYFQNVCPNYQPATQLQITERRVQARTLQVLIQYIKWAFKIALMDSRTNLYQFKVAAVNLASPSRSAAAHAWSTSQLKKEWAAITVEHAAFFHSLLFSSLS